MKKLKKKKGETLGETLAALLVAVLGLTMLAGAIVSAAKTNSRIDGISVMKGSSDTSVTMNVTISNGGGNPLTPSVQGYRQEDGGLYYEEN